jgi:hypothetical protein
MSLRHAAALTLVGWYLMVPSIECLPRCLRFDGGAPLSIWRQLGSFDSVRDCQTQLTYDVLRPTKVLYPPDCNLLHTEQMQPYSETCVASDDPRLRER